MFCLLLICAKLLALTSCTSTEEPLSNTINENLNNILKFTYDVTPAQNMSDVILILGDLDGEPCELSRFLRNNRTPVEERGFRFPSYDADIETGILIIDVPSFNDYQIDEVYDLITAFTNKIIFDHADRLKIVLVVPDDIYDREGFIRYTLMVTKLVRILGLNYESFKESIALVGTMTAENGSYSDSEEADTEEDVLYSLHELLYRDFTDINFFLTKVFVNESLEMKDHILKLYSRRNAFLSQLKKKGAFGVFKRPGKNDSLWSEENRNKLRETIFDILSFSEPVRKDRYQVVVDTRRTQMYLSKNSNLFQNKKLLKSLSRHIATAVLQSNFRVGNNAHMEMLNTLLSLHTDLTIERSRVTSFYDNFLSKIIEMTENQFSEYVASLNPETGKRWRRFNFELEKLDFFERQQERNVSLVDFDVKSLIINDVNHLRQYALKTYSTNPQDKSEYDYDYGEY